MKFQPQRPVIKSCWDRLSCMPAAAFVLGSDSALPRGTKVAMDGLQTDGRGRDPKPLTRLPTSAVNPRPCRHSKKSVASSSQPDTWRKRGKELCRDRWTPFLFIFPWIFHILGFPRRELAGLGQSTAHLQGDNCVRLWEYAACVRTYFFF